MRRYKVIEKSSDYDELLRYIKSKRNIKSVGILCGDMSNYEVYIFLEDCNEIHKFKVNESNMINFISELDELDINYEAI